MRKVPKRLTLATLTVCTLLLLTSCSQSQIYAADKTSGVYVAIPKGWHKIPNTQLNSAESKSTAEGAAERLASVIWQEAYTTSPEVTPPSIFSLDAPDGAVVYVRVRDLNYDDMNSISYNSLRNLIVPITTWLEDPSKANSKFMLHDDYERVEKIARGVRTIFTFADPAGISETVDQTALVSDDRSRIYVLLVRAQTKYFKKHAKELQAIGDSFTVRGNK
jgi:hypothetical protein